MKIYQLFLKDNTYCGSVVADEIVEYTNEQKTFKLNGQVVCTWWFNYQFAQDL